MYIYIYRYLIWLQRVDFMDKSKSLELTQELYDASIPQHDKHGANITFGWDIIINGFNTRYLEISDISDMFKFMRPIPSRSPTDDIEEGGDPVSNKELNDFIDDRIR